MAEFFSHVYVLHKKQSILVTEITELSVNYNQWKLDHQFHVEPVGHPFYHHYSYQGMSMIQ